jgi:hypothetical protein
MEDASPRAKNSRRCTNDKCEFGGRWIVGKMTRLKNGRLLCLGRECHSVYDPAEVIHPESEDYRLWVA